MAGWWFHHKTRNEKALKFGLSGAPAARSIYTAPRPTRHVPTECRAGSLCGERRGDRVSIGRRHLLARPTKGLQRQTQTIVARLLPSIAVRRGSSPGAVFEHATNEIPVAAGEYIVGFSEVRRVHIEDTGVIALERTRCTQRPNGSRIVTLYWAVYIGTEQCIRMASICAEGEAELRTYRTQVADFLRRWTAAAAVPTGRSLLLR